MCRMYLDSDTTRCQKMIATVPAGRAHCKHCKKVKNKDLFQDSDGKKTSTWQMYLVDSDTTRH